MNRHSQCIRDNFWMIGTWTVPETGASGSWRSKCCVVGTSRKPPSSSPGEFPWTAGPPLRIWRPWGGPLHWRSVHSAWPYGGRTCSDQPWLRNGIRNTLEPKKLPLRCSFILNDGPSTSNFYTCGLCSKKMAIYKKHIFKKTHFNYSRLIKLWFCW